MHYCHIHKNISCHIKYCCFSFHVKLMCAAHLVLNIVLCCLIFVFCNKDTTINAESVNLDQIIFLLHKGHLCVCCVCLTLFQHADNRLTLQAFSNLRPSSLFLALPTQLWKHTHPLWWNNKSVKQCVCSKSSYRVCRHMAAAFSVPQITV